MKSIVIFLFFCYLFNTAGAQGKIEAIQINGTSVDIYTPPNYDNSKKYPVVYFNDGQMLFGHISLTIALQHILDSLISNELIREVIVVGVFADQLRAEKYVPYQDDRFERMEDGSSYANWYEKFVTKVLIPYVDSNYKTIQKSEGRAIFGFSFGGLNAVWMTLNHPELFSMAAGISASLWVDDFKIYSECEKYQANQKIWFDIGTNEWSYYVPFQKKLSDAGGVINESIYYFEVEGAAHTWEYVRDRVHMPFLVFAGLSEHQPVKMDVIVEIIPSQQDPTIRYTRLNPVIRCKDGLTYSLAYTASYEVLNPEAGKVYEEGRFEVFGKENLEVLVSYGSFSKKVKIKAKLIN